MPPTAEKLKNEAASNKYNNAITNLLLKMA